MREFYIPYDDYKKHQVLPNVSCKDDGIVVDEIKVEANHKDIFVKIKRLDDGLIVQLKDSAEEKGNERPIEIDTTDNSSGEQQ